MFVRVVFLLLLSAPSFAQVKTTVIDKTAIPGTIKYKGNIVYAVTWVDSLGKNMVLATETGSVASAKTGDEGFNDITLYAYHYVVTSDSTRVLWKMSDQVLECPVDLVADFVKQSFAVTDLDKNGKAEVWMTYRIGCYGGVDPITMKLLMYEGGKKHAMRGTTRVKVSDKDYIGGEYKFDDTFTKAAAAFRRYAAGLWEKYKKSEE